MTPGSQTPSLPDTQRGVVASGDNYSYVYNGSTILGPTSHTDDDLDDNVYTGLASRGEGKVSIIDDWFGDDEIAAGGIVVFRRRIEGY